jgi:hypothetical protein
VLMLETALRDLGAIWFKTGNAAGDGIPPRRPLQCAAVFPLEG